VYSSYKLALAPRLCRQHFAAHRSKRQPVAALSCRHCGLQIRTAGAIAPEKRNQVFHAAGVRLCHVPDAHVRSPAERQNRYPQHI